MFLRRNRPRDHFSRKPEKQQQKRQTKRRKPNKCLQAALDVDVMRNEYFVDPTPDEATEVTRILESKNFFEVLELDHKDDLDEKEDELRQSYLRKVLLLNTHISSHPRMTEAFTKLSQAYDVLSDPILRMEHKYNQYGGRPQAADTLGAMLESLFEDDMQMMPMGTLMQPAGRGRRRQQDPMLGLMNAFFNGFEAPGRTLQQQRQRRGHTLAQPRRQARRGSGDSDDSEMNDIADIARMMFGNFPALSPAERRRREREEQRRLRMENQRRQAEERQQQEQAEEAQEENDLNLGDLLQLMVGGAPRPQPQRTRQTVTVIAPGNVRFVRRTQSGVQPPIARARPVEAAAPSRREQRRGDIRRQQTNDLEQSLATLMGMGFSEEDSLRALDYANGKVEDAITLLLN